MIRRGWHLLALPTPTGGGIPILKTNAFGTGGGTFFLSRLAPVQRKFMEP